MGLDETIFADLNAEQRAAVTAPERHLLVVAGPGTGKTLTVVRRIAHLIHQGINPENIAAVTFTNRAAGQMRERAHALLGKEVSGAFIGTLHLLGLKILKNCLPGNFVVYGRDEQIALLKSLLKGPSIKVADLAERISSIKCFTWNMDDETKNLYYAYERALQKNNALDFDDLIIKPIELINDIGLPGQYRGRFSHIVVDEYQDINPAQCRLLKLLAGHDGNVCAVGDPDQAIYAFRGADVETFLSFEKDFQGTKRVVLVHSYRSTDTIVSASGNVIANNTRRIEKALVPFKASGGRISVFSVPDERAEGEIIVDEIEARIGGTSHYRLMHTRQTKDFSDSAYGFSDFAVLVRTNTQAKILEEVLGESGIPCQFIGKKHAEKRKRIMEMVSLLAASTEKDAMNSLLGEIREELISLGLFMNEGLDSPSTAVDILNELCLLAPGDDFDPRADAVSLMTLHMAKGLEFGVVFIAGVEEGLIPYTITKSPVDLEEERRLFYVGMTRAKEGLFLIHARKRFLYGRQTSPCPSPFLQEIPEQFLSRRTVPDRVKRPLKDQQMKLF